MALEGTLQYPDISFLFRVIGSAHKSGVLEISWEDRRARMHFDRGRLTCAESTRVSQGLGTFLVRAGCLTEEELTRALEIQKAEGGDRRLGGILCDEFGLEPDEIEEQLRHQFAQVAFDVLSWPGGSFVMEFHEPRATHDRFHLDPVEFILAVGIEAGLLAEEGVERDRARRERRHVAFLEENPLLLSRCREHWQKKGYWVVSSDVPREFLGYLGEWREDLPVLVVSESCGQSLPGGEGGGLAVLEAIRAEQPGVTAVVVGDDSPEFERRARQAGASGVVARPGPGELEGPEADLLIEVFLVALERAVAVALQRPPASTDPPP